MVDDLTAQSGQLFVPLLNLLIQRLIFNLQLLVIDQVETFCKLLLFLQYFLLIGQSISQCDVLKSILMNFLIFGLIGFLPLLDDLCTKFLARAAMHSVHGHGSLQLLELLLNLSALGLLLIELILQLARHSIIAILGLFQVVPDLVHVSEGVEVLVLVKHLVGALILITRI